MHDPYADTLEVYLTEIIKWRDNGSVFKGLPSYNKNTDYERADGWYIVYDVGKSARTCSCGKSAQYGHSKCTRCRVKERAKRLPSCNCGKPYFARKMCRSCYYKEYNKTRIR